VKNLIYAFKWLKNLTVLTRRSQLLLEKEEQDWGKGEKIGTSFVITKM
jgi:hypothetical protein